MLLVLRAAALLIRRSRPREVGCAHIGPPLTAPQLHQTPHWAGGAPLVWHVPLLLSDLIPNPAPRYLLARGIEPGAPQPIQPPTQLRGLLHGPSPDRYVGCIGGRHVAHSRAKSSGGWWFNVVATALHSAAAVCPFVAKAPIGLSAAEREKFLLSTSSERSAEPDANVPISACSRRLVVFGWSLRCGDR